MGSVTELCQGALHHAGELLTAEGATLSLVKKVYGGGSDLEEVIALTTIECCKAHQELLQDVMELVLATGSPINLKDAQKVMFFV